LIEVILCNCIIVSQDKHFEKTQVKHKTKFILSETKYNDSTLIDKLLSLCVNHDDLKYMLQKIVWNL
jgi:hypothetical protein